MMKTIYRLFVAAACATSMGLTSCIEETVPTSLATEEQMASSSKASEALVWAMPAFFNHLGTYSSDYHYDYGIGSIMHIRDVMTGDMAVVSHSYNWYDSWSTNSYLGPRYVSTYFTWAYYMRAIQTTNSVVGRLKDTEDPIAQGSLSAGYATRAMLYLDIARMYEFLPNDIYDAEYVTSEKNKIAYLTTPIVDETTTEAGSQNNPRVDHETMAAFIASDLEKAETLMEATGYNPANKTLPSLACVYGVEARLHMWNAGYYEETGDDAKAQEEYTAAKTAARNAISNAENARPVSEDEWLDTKTGFNSMSNKAWLWASSTNGDDDVVHTGIVNWTSWMSPEATFGYASAGPVPMIASELYDKMSSKDFRKLSFKAPANTSLSGKEPLVEADKSKENYVYEVMPTYAGFKFRPGAGNAGSYEEGAVADYPLMRIEEMYFIEAEAAAHLDAAEGKNLLTTFMKSYRNSSYACSASSTDGVVSEIMLQKRIEFWGEGITFFDYKRLNMPVDRTKSKNWADTERFQTTSRPEWMNFCIPINEENNNKGVKGFNNPDPSNLYTPVM